MTMLHLVSSAALVLSLLHLCSSTCDTYPIRLPGRTVDGSLSEPRSCPSQDDLNPIIDQLERELDRIIEAEIPTLQQFTVPFNCPGTGWMKLVDFSLERDGQDNTSCPGNWTKSEKNSISHCTIPNALDCGSAYFGLPPHIQYREVCGRVKGYQTGPTTAFFRQFEGISSGIENSYLDGVSLTHGNPRTHIWSFATGYTAQQASKVTHKCPCSSSNNSLILTLPSFIEDHYFCDSATAADPLRSLFYSSPLWSDGGCMPGGGCCQESQYFSRTLAELTCDPVEIRLCHDQALSEFTSIGVSEVELYVK